jgi:hypothetical protein
MAGEEKKTLSKTLIYAKSNFVTKRIKNKPKKPQTTRGHFFMILFFLFFSLAQFKVMWLF